VSHDYLTSHGADRHSTGICRGLAGYLTNDAWKTSLYKTKKVSVPKETNGREDVPDTATAFKKEQ